MGDSKNAVQVYPKLISTEPCGQDLYEGRSQQRTAEIIAEHINNHTFKLIGIDGSWGAGKSNVIGIIKNLLTNSHHVFIYDAWSHQEDLQRRSFLEELTDDLQRNNIIDQKEWEPKLNALLARRRVINTKQVPKLSKGLIVSVLVVLFVPIFKALSEAVPAEVWPWRLMVTSIPVIAAIFYFAFLIRKKDKDWDWREAFSLYQDKKLETEVNEHISEKEPSVREFRKWMNDLARAIKTKANKQLVIVFDNIDRLPPEKVQALWSSIHTFFSDRKQEDVYDDIAVMVPFDKSHVQEAFKLTANESADTASHFINKTFPVVFTISPAVLTDWKKFFLLKFEEAFGEAEKTEYDNVVTIFDLYNDQITPRGMIAYINDLVGLKMIWKNDIELRYLALYLATRKDIIAKPLSNLLNGGYAQKADIIFRGDETLMNKIAALVYNVSLEKASQVTLTRETELALRNKNVATIRELAKHTDFSAILDRVINSKSVDIVSCVFTLDQFENALAENDGIKAGDLLNIWSHLISVQLGLDANTQAFSDVHRALLKRSGMVGKTQLMMNFLCTQFSNADPFRGRDYFIAMQALESFIKASEIPTDIKQFVKPKKVSAEVFVDFLAEAKEMTPHYGLSCDHDQLDAVLAAKFPEQLEAIPIVGYADNKYMLPVTIAKVKTFMTDGSPGIANLLAAQALLKVLHDTPPLLNAFMPDSHIHALLGQAPANTDVYYELAAMRIARGAAYGEPGGASTTLMNNFNENVADEVLKRIENYKIAGQLILEGLDWKNAAGTLVIKRMVQKKPLPGARLNIAKVLPKFYEIAAWLEVESDLLLRFLNDWHGNVEAACASSGLEKIIPDLRFYDDVFASSYTIEKSLTKAGLTYLAGITEEQWKNILLDENSYAFRLLEIFFNHAKIKETPDAAVNGLKSVFLHLAANEIPGLLAKAEAFQKFYSHADQSLLVNVAENVRDTLINHNSTSAAQFLFFEWLLREHGKMINRSSEVVRTILNPVAVNRNILTTLLAHESDYLPVLTSAGESAIDFILSARTMVEKESDWESLHRFEHMISKQLFDGIVIKSAYYHCPAEGAADGKDVTAEMKRRVEQEGWTHFKIGNDIAGGYDPLEGKVKQLKFFYDYKGEEVEKELGEHTWVNLPF